MPRYHIRIHLLGLAVIAGMCSSLIGCADGANSVNSTGQYATAEALISRFNELNTAEPVDVPAMVALFFSENETQQRMLDAVRAHLDLYELDAAMRGEYNTPFQSSPMEIIFALAMHPAAVAFDNGQRAYADYIDHHEMPMRLHLVKHSTGWRISCSTLEQEPRLKETFDRGEWLGMDGSLQHVAAVAPMMISRIRAAEFHSARQARAALDAMLEGG